MAGQQVEDGFFVVLTIHRGDVEQALQEQVSFTREESVRAGECLSNADMSRLAEEVGDILLSGGDYWEGIAQEAVRILARKGMDI